MFQDNDEDVVKVLRSASNPPCKAAFLSLFGLKWFQRIIDICVWTFALSSLFLSEPQERL